MRHAIWLRYIQTRTLLVWLLSRIYVQVSLFICAPALDDVRENIRHLREQIENINDDVDDLQGQIDDLDTEYVEKSDFESMERDVEDLRDTVDSLDRDVSDMDRRLDGVQDDVTNLKKEDIDAT